MPAERDRTIDALTAAFAAGELSMDEFERRVETANRSDDAATLRRLLADLTRFASDTPSTMTTTGPGAHWSTGSRSSGSSHYSGPWGAGKDNDYGRRRAGKADQVAIFSSSRRIGRWTLAKKLDSVAIFGSCLIDLRQADIPPEGGRIDGVALFGSVQILVPQGLNVRVNGVSIFGSATGSGDIVGDDDAPWIDIEGVAIFGSVEVKVVP
jgi:hypothetical protein